MKLQELKNWDKLTPAEQDRLKEVYGEDAEITKTTHDTEPASLEKARAAEKAKGAKNG